MTRGAIARRYGYALFQKGLEKGNLAEIDWDFDVIIHVFKDFPRIRRSYEDKKVYAERKKEQFGHFFADVIHDTMMRFLFVVIENYREEYLFAMGHEFLRLYRQHRGIVEASMITALPLSEDHIAKIETSLREVTGKQVVLEAKHDPSLIGGAILRFGDVVMDTTVAHQLKRMEKEMRAEVRQMNQPPAEEVK